MKRIRDVFRAPVERFDSLPGPRRPIDAEELRRQLFEAADVGDRARLSTLARAHADVVAANFAVWSRVPAAVRGNPAMLERYASAVIAIAQVFATDLGRPELIEQLRGRGGGNLFADWECALRRAQSSMTSMRYAETARMLEGLLVAMCGVAGPAADRYLPITYGLLGECYFHCGEAVRSVSVFQSALEICQRVGDLEGIAAYCSSLYENHRYLGNAAEAAAVAERHAATVERLGDTSKAARLRKAARLVRAGEPLCRILVEITGVCYEVDELPEAPGGHVRFLFERNRISLRPARALVEKGEALGSAGQFDEALGAFCEASRLDPFAPEPRYLGGQTLLYLRRYRDAVAAFEVTEAIAPGWYECRSDRWLAERLASGHLPHEVLLGVREIEDSDAAREYKANLAGQMLAAHPDVPLLYLLRGIHLEALNHPNEARAAYREGLRRKPEPDVQTRLLLRLGLVSDRASERLALLGEARSLGGNLTASAMASVALKYGWSSVPDAGQNRFR